MNEGDLAPERRKACRLKVNFTVIYKVKRPLETSMKIGNKEVRALISDLSENGMGIMTELHIPASTILLIQFTLINPKAKADDENRMKSMKIEGEVRYCRFVGDGHRLGILFTQIDRDDKQIISNLVNSGIK